MIVVGGLLLGAVLTAPGALGHTSPAGSLADPFDPSIPRAILEQQDEALGLRNPFDGPHAIRRRVAEVARVDLRDPFSR